MAIFQCTVNAYDLSIQSPTGSTQYEGVIHLRGAFGLAFLHFVPDGVALPSNRKRPGQHAFDVYYRMSLWTFVVDMLRNEKQVTLFFDEADNSAIFSAGREAVGEEGFARHAEFA